ncbi:MAG: protease complex subunit PrcB family protein [bacterium]
MGAPESFNLTAHIWDWQAPPSGLPGVEAWVDLTPVGGPDFYPLFDDGQHGDGAPHDGIWGCFFEAIPDPNSHRCLTVHAVDWESYRHENDVCFQYSQPPDCLPQEVIDEGPMGFANPTEIIVRDHNTWANIWRELHPNQTPPPINFELHQAVVVGLGERISSGFSVHIDCVKRVNDSGGIGTHVQYTEEIPAPECPVENVVTTPYQIVITPKTTGPDHFTHNERVYNCPDGQCVDQRDLVRGNHSLIHEPRWQVIYTPEAWWQFWNEHGGNIPEPPLVEFPHEMVVVGMIGDRPTTGWSVNIECVKFLNNDTSDPVILIEAVEVKPGPNCVTEHVITQPFHFVAVPAFEGRVDVILRHEIDPCGPPPPECVDFRVLADGNHSMIREPVERMITNNWEWHQFWSQHNPDPSIPPPEVDWMRENAVVLMTGERNTGGYWIEINCVRLLDDPQNGRVTLVEYTEMIPGPDCPVPDVITQPFLFIAVPKLVESRADFIKHEFVYECPPPDCHPFRPLAEGNFSQIHEPVEAAFNTLPVGINSGFSMEELECHQRLISIPRSLSH